MCKLLLPRCTFHTFPKNVCFLFTRSRKRMKPKLHCVSAFRRQWGRGVTWVCFILCNVFRAQSAISVEILAFPSEYLCPYHKKRLRVLSFPQWQWESWPKTLAPAMALPNVLLLPVISDYIMFGNEDIFACWRSWSDPIPRRWGHKERQTTKLSRKLLSNPNCNSMLTFVKQKESSLVCKLLGESYKSS